MRVPSGSSKTIARSSGQNSPSWLPSEVIFTTPPPGVGPGAAQAASASDATPINRFFMAPPLLCRLLLAEHGGEGLRGLGFRLLVDLRVVGERQVELPACRGRLRIGGSLYRARVRG